LTSFITSIEIENFRNLTNTRATFDQKINCIIGKNGEGKTSLIEAVYFSVFHKSFRKSTRFDQVVQKGLSSFILKASFTENDTIENYALKVRSDSKDFYLNSKKAKKKSNIKMVVINPFDSFIFFNNPAARRDWLDDHISILDDAYNKEFRSFKKALKMRNTLLSGLYSHDQFFYAQIRAIDWQIAKYSKAIGEKRQKYLSELQVKIKTIFIELFNTELKINLDFNSELRNYSEQEIYDFYQKNLKLDLKVKRTLKGIHRDEFNIKIEDMPANEYGSIGQQKISYLSLLFSYVELLEDSGNYSPILLLDDISGELDSLCWKNLLNYLKLKNLQVLITTANEVLGIELGKKMKAKQIFVEAGNVREISA
jgi:DNA replication and repair protein RecF